jgi:LuxR family maltose regulon positive regulatory protein
MEHLLQMTDWERSVRLASNLALQMYMAGQLPTLQRWLRTIGDATIERYPPLAVNMCWAAAMTGDTAGAQRWAAFVDAASFDGAPVDGSASFDSARAMLRAAMCPAGPETMMADAAFAVAQEPAWSPWRAEALWGLGQAHLLAGHLDEAGSVLTEASAVAVAMGNTDTSVICDSDLALLAIDRGDWQEAAGRLERALATIDEHRLHDYVACLLAFAEAARLSLHRSDLSEVDRQLARAMRARPSATYVIPYIAVRLRLQLAKVYLALAEVAMVRQLLREIDDILRHRPALGTLAGEVEEFRRVLASSATTEVAGRSPLTQAELRMLPYLQTHLTAGEIAERMFLSTHTVKSRFKSIYRKLGVSSRSEAVQEATTLGLLGG